MRVHSSRKGGGGYASEHVERGVSLNMRGWADGVGLLRLVFVGGVAAWFGGSVATGQREVGLSAQWLLPATAWAIAFFGSWWATTVVPFGPLSFLSAPRLVSMTQRGAGPIRQNRTIRGGEELGGWGPIPWAVGWCLVTEVALWTSDERNHVWATDARWRAVVGAPVVVGLAMAGCWSIGRRTGHLSYASDSRPQFALFGMRCSVFLASLAFFVATASGQLVTPDEWTIHGAAVGLVEHGRLVVYDGEPYSFTLTGVIRQRDDQTSAPPKYPLLASLIVAPFHAIGRIVGGETPVDAARYPPSQRALPSVSVLVGATTAALLVLVATGAARAVRQSWHAALIVAAAVTTGSLVWPYSRTILNMGIAGVALTAAFATVVARPTQSVGIETRWALLSGVLLGLTGVARFEYIVLALPLWCLLGWVSWWAGHTGQGRTRRALGEFVLATVGAGVVLGVGVFAYNLARTGSWRDFGYGDEGALASLLEKPWYGWFGLLFSPGCGVLTAAPLLFVGGICLVWLWEDAPAPSVAIASVAILATAYYGSVSSTWCAQTTWGPRYFVTISPLLLLSIGAAWRRVNRANPFVWLAIGGPWLANAVTNLLAVVVDFSRGWQDHWALGVTYQSAAWVPYFSGITAHVRVFRSWVMGGQAPIDVYWLRSSDGTPSVFGVVVVVALLGTSAFFAGRCWEIGSDLSDRFVTGDAGASGQPSPADVVGAPEPN